MKNSNLEDTTDEDLLSFDVDRLYDNLLQMGEVTIIIRNSQFGICKTSHKNIEDAEKSFNIVRNHLLNQSS